MDHQDWNTIIIKKKNINNVQGKKEKVVKPKSQTTTKNNISNKKLENSEDLKHTYVPKEIALDIQKRRQIKGLTVKELSQKLNMKPQDITSIEQGKALYNKALINKILRGLNSEFYHKTVAFRKSMPAFLSRG